jgi:regulatory protein YycH of two-component signal transduction system YycFG
MDAEIAAMVNSIVLSWDLWMFIPEKSICQSGSDQKKNKQIKSEGQIDTDRHRQTD